MQESLFIRFDLLQSEVWVSFLPGDVKAEIDGSEPLSSVMGRSTGRYRPILTFVA